MKKLWEWLQNNYIRIGVLFLLFFIPLYPKLPLIDVIRTWVYIRLEDFFIAALAALFLIKAKQNQWRDFQTPLTTPIFVYWTIGAVSLIYSLFFLGRFIPNYFPHLAILHYFRRIEYMIVFFIAASAIRSLRHVYVFLTVFALTVLGVVLYGLGQKYMGYPAFLTMNEEFAKGVPLYLSATSRITSTFAGHYDLAAFLMFALAFFTSIFFGVRRIAVKIGLTVLCLASFIVLLLTASRVSLTVCLAAILMVLWLQGKKKWIIPLVFLSVVLFSQVTSATDRFAKTFRLRQVVYDIDQGRPIAIVATGSDGRLVIEKSKSPAEENLPIGSGYINIPIAPVKQQLDSGAIASISGRFILQNALVYDISLTTRFQGQWPKALEAFGRNIFLGSGYSTLSLAADSDYMRALGETGVLGFVSFFSIFVAYLLFAKFATTGASPIVRSMLIGTTAGLGGLLLNAIVIDVFEASKVAYTVWIVLGAATGAALIHEKRRFPLWQMTKRILIHPSLYIVGLLILTIIIFGNAVHTYFVADDFTWLRWAASSYLSDIPTYFTDATGFFYRPLSKLYFFIAYALFWLKPMGYHLINLLFHFGSTSLVYLLGRKITRSPYVAVSAALLFLILAMHHENIVWISGFSSLASGFFSLLSLYLYILFVQDCRKHWWGFFSSLLTSFLAVFLYEGVFFLPIAIIAYALMFDKKSTRWVSFLFLFVNGFYWYARQSAHAIVPSGTYAIHLAVLPFNIVGNILGYGMLTLFGPQSMGAYQTIRVLLRQQPVISAVISLVAVMFIIAVWRKYRNVYRLPKHYIFFLLFSVIMLGSSLGLGNIAERYGYVASAGMSIVFVGLLYEVYMVQNKRIGLKGKLVIAILFLTVYISNYVGLLQTFRDWERAGKMTNKILSTIRDDFPPLPTDRKFVFAQVPTRIGRAWVFPTGLADALFHVFRDENLQVDVVGTSREAEELKKMSANTRSFIIEGDDVKEISYE